MQGILMMLIFLNFSVLKLQKAKETDRIHAKNPIL
jgi:hypothetical protein